MCHLPSPEKPWDIIFSANTVLLSYKLISEPKDVQDRIFPPTSSSPLSIARVYIVRSFVPIAKKSQFFARVSDINAAAGVSINTPIFGIFNSIFFFFF